MALEGLNSFIKIYFFVMLKNPGNKIWTENLLMTILTTKEMTNVTTMHNSSCVTHMFWSFRYLVFILEIFLASAGSDLLLEAPIHWLYFHVKFENVSCPGFCSLSLKSVLIHSFLLILYWISLAYFTGDTGTS